VSMFNRLSIKLLRIHPRWRENFGHLEAWTNQPEKYTDYLIPQLSGAIITEFVVLFVIFLYLLRMHDYILKCNEQLVFWMFWELVILFFDISLKTLLLNHLRDIYNSCDDHEGFKIALKPYITTYAFYLNKHYPKIRYISFAVYVLFIRKSQFCSTVPSFKFITELYEKCLISWILMSYLHHYYRFRTWSL
jgi:hypothetical protein